MTYEERQKRNDEIRAKVNTWQAQLDALAVRPDEPLSERAFCKLYGFDPTMFNKKKCLKNMPRDISAEEKAFEKERKKTARYQARREKMASSGK